MECQCNSCLNVIFLTKCFTVYHISWCRHLVRPSLPFGQCPKFCTLFIFEGFPNAGQRFTIAIFIWISFLEILSGKQEVNFSKYVGSFCTNYASFEYPMVWLKYKILHIGEMLYPIRHGKWGWGYTILAIMQLKTFLSYILFSLIQVQVKRPKLQFWIKAEH